VNKTQNGVAWGESKLSAQQKKIGQLIGGTTNVVSMEAKSRSRTARDQISIVKSL